MMEEELKKDPPAKEPEQPAEKKSGSIRNAGAPCRDGREG